MPPEELAERLGHPADARVVIINADELGASHATNTGVYDALRNGLASSATIMPARASMVVVAMATP